MVKNAGQSWGGSWIGLDNPIDFSSGKIFKMKVFSPRVGAKVLLKVENNDNGSIFFEKEVETTVSNEWEELEFDYSGINEAESYQKIVLIFDNGTMGDGSENFTYLFDDIMLTQASSVLQNHASTVSIYRNNETIMVNTDADFLNGYITVYSVSGKLLLNQRINSSMEKLRLTESGILLVRVSNDANNRTVSKKIIK